MMACRLFVLEGCHDTIHPDDDMQPSHCGMKPSVRLPLEKYLFVLPRVNDKTCFIRVAVVFSITLDPSATSGCWCAVAATTVLCCPLFARSKQCRLCLMCLVLRCCTQPNDGMSMLELETELELAAFSALHNKPLVCVDGQPVSPSVHTADHST